MSTIHLQIKIIFKASQHYCLQNKEHQRTIQVSKESRITDSNTFLKIHYLAQFQTGLQYPALLSSKITSILQFQSSQFTHSIRFILMLTPQRLHHGSSQPYIKSSPLIFQLPSEFHYDLNYQTKPPYITWPSSGTIATTFMFTLMQTSILSWDTDRSSDLSK